jgi:hypothetical protein
VLRVGEVRHAADLDLRHEPRVGPQQFCPCEQAFQE